LKSTFSAQQFPRWQCGSVFIRLAVVASQTCQLVQYSEKIWTYSSSRSSKVDDFGNNRKRICDFLLVRNSNFGPILHRFGLTRRFMCSSPHPYSTLILGVFPLHQIAHVGVSVGLKLFGRKIILEEFQPMWSRYLNFNQSINGNLYSASYK